MKNAYANLALTLSFEFQKYLMQHPHVARRIPQNARIVFQLDGNPAFNRWAKSLAKRGAKAKDKVVTVRVRAMGPPVSRIKAVELVS